MKLGSGFGKKLEPWSFDDKQLVFHGCLKITPGAFLSRGIS